ncbi:nitroreductase family deazaflavin-dependent oxidoreductase [Streptomyces sp. WAC 04229]|uniref:nitroreductase family deazaflavin-dependent oxidoreductase n=1 Tax=Streptomyces sp. WAC 04229 TaxID=2203206 RepID=UPI000F74A962|nr:nitroreductase family deazaflavin-dependent oxidoreductase [Streptomyces sp. WAC 04229]RSN57764.1 nitroreductase family deazaflavin-dependent oxidoreductase [Streptomyces sp. WAC 04229]
MTPRNRHPAAYAAPRLHRRLLTAVGNSRLLRRWGPRLLPLLDLLAHRLTKNRWMPSRMLASTAVLRTTRRDGTPHLTPLIAGPDPSGSFLVMATNFGRRHHPAWSGNLLREPRAVLDWKGTSIPVRAHLLTPRQQDEARHRILEVMPVFDDYARRSRRHVRVFTLTPDPGDR